jgi:hypothetical protein
MLNNIKQQLSDLEVSEQSNPEKRRSLDEIKELFQSHILEIVQANAYDSVLEKIEDLELKLLA